ncbi:MAG: fused MFS/spermidine synthase [Alicyclobacillus macrosporangiidus]|uniref:spermidine synthase n=1 Tax=Alicyclobacillus macrosporangiidus TaxID=392015 RepID=UPI0026EF9543|nr:fused MFS/spermidine synthase [Alicyclobacillus macrosporangiidus]MCL6599551.1 fused MFS/spermidine synthase [Alicyclobacillus macrosporangiidus]
MHLPKSFLYVYVTITGAAVMALELAASRFVAPYFGTSMMVWANIIGLILLCMSIGYWMGGRVADRRPHPRLLMSITLAAGLWSALLPAFGQAIFARMSGGILGTPVSVIVVSFAAILLVFAPPVLLLAMVSPFAIRLVQADPSEVGKAAGNLYAFSTAGSLLGTFGTAFGTIPFLGTRATLWLWAALLILISAVGLGRTAWRWVGASGTAVPAVVALALPSAAPSHTGGQVLYGKDTLYQHVQVERTADGSIALVYNEGGGIQSLRRPGDALQDGDYYDDYLVLPDLVAGRGSGGPPGAVADTGVPAGAETGSSGPAGAAVRGTPPAAAPSAAPSADPGPSVLVLGSAGGTIPHLMNVYDRDRFPNLNITGVEIDGDVIPLDYRYFGLTPDDARIVHQDARAYVRQAAAAGKRYDVAIVDAYSQQIYIPFHLSTREFFEEVRSVLTPRGLVALNVNAVSPDSRLLLSMERTVGAVFPHLYVMKARGAYNYIVIGSNDALQPASLQVIPENSPLAAVRKEWEGGLREVSGSSITRGMLLTDDRAPVEMLTDSMIWQVARGEM